MDELLDWKHIAGPSPDLSTVVKLITDYLFSAGLMTLDHSIAKDHSSVHPSVCPSVYCHSEPCLNRSGYYNTFHGGVFSFMMQK